MLSSYQFDKKLKEHETVARTARQEEQWLTWKDRKEPAWLRNYRRRIEKFVVDVWGLL